MKLTNIQLLIIFIIGIGTGIAGTGAIYELKRTKAVVQLNSDLQNQIQELNIQAAILKGQVSAITDTYNNHDARLEVIEDKMRIFNGGN
jgi:hypothetical protein